MENGYQLSGLTFASRMWKLLGFGYPYVERPEDGPDWAPGWICTVTVTHFDWRDRLRILVSGRVRMETISQTDVPIARMKSSSATAVLPPNVD